MKIPKELRKAINRNADYCKKELGTRGSQEKCTGETTAELKAAKSRMNRAEERICDLEELWKPPDQHIGEQVKKNGRNGTESKACQQRPNVDCRRGRKTKGD